MGLLYCPFILGPEVLSSPTTSRISVDCRVCIIPAECCVSEFYPETIFNSKLMYILATGTKLRLTSFIT